MLSHSRLICKAAGIRDDVLVAAAVDVSHSTADAVRKVRRSRVKLHILRFYVSDRRHLTFVVYFFVTRRRS